MNKSGGGTGSVFLVKGSDVFHYKFYKDGECHRGSTGKRTESESRRVLMEKILAAGAGKLETAASRRMTLTGLSKLVFADYEKQGDDSLARQEDAFVGDEIFRSKLPGREHHIGPHRTVCKMASDSARRALFQAQAQTRAV